MESLLYSTADLAEQKQNQIEMIQELMKSKSGKLDLNISAPSGYGVETEGFVPSGINVHTSSTKK